MNPTLLSLIGLRLLAVYLLANGITVLSSSVPLLLFSARDGNADVAIVAWTLLSYLLPVIVAVMLWLLAPRLAVSLVNRKNLGDTAPFTTPQLQTIAVSTAGLLILVTSLPTLASQLVQLIRLREVLDSGSGIDIRFQSTLIGTALRAALGLALVVGAGGLSRLVHRLRRIGLDR